MQAVSEVLRNDIDLQTVIFLVFSAQNMKKYLDESKLKRELQSSLVLLFLVLLSKSH